MKRNRMIYLAVVIFLVWFCLEPTGVQGYSAADAYKARFATFFKAGIESAQGNDMGSYTAMALSPIDHSAFISYYDWGNKQLKLAHYVGQGGINCSNPLWTCITVDNTNMLLSDIHFNKSLSPNKIMAIDLRGYLIAGNQRLQIGILYHQEAEGSTPGMLKFAERFCDRTGQICQPWVIYQVDANLSDAGRYGVSFKYDVHGIPHIAYTASTYHQSDVNPTRDTFLKYAKWVSSGGNCGTPVNAWQCTTVNQRLGSPYYNYVMDSPSLAIAPDSSIVIGYHDQVSGNVRVVKNAGVSPFTENIETTGNTPAYVSLDIFDATPDVIELAYLKYSGTPYKFYLQYTYSRASGGNCGNQHYQCSTLDNNVVADSQDPIMGVSFLIDPLGIPVVAYYSNTRLMFAFGTPFPGGTNACSGLSNWVCKPIDLNGNPGKYASMALDDSGLAYIAYYENFMDGNLVFVSQRLVNFLPNVHR